MDLWMLMEAVIALLTEDQHDASKLAVASLQDDLDNRYPLLTNRG